MCRRLIRLASFVLLLGIVLTSAAEAADPSLVLYLPFLEGAGEPRDFSAYEHGVELVNNPKWIDGKHGKALEFDGTNYVRVPINDTLQLRETFTVEFWVKREASQPANWNYMVAGGNLKWAVIVNADQSVYVWTRSGGTWAQRLVTSIPLTTDWTHIAMTYDVGSGVELYFNAEKAGEGGSPPVVDELDDSIMVGARAPGQEFFAGIVDEVALYNRILTLDEIRQDMQAVGEPLPYASGPNPQDGAMLEATWASLSWWAGDFAVSRDVYIGESFDDVNDGAEGVFVGNQATTTLIVGFAGFPIPNGLVPGTTYYWRINEVNDADPNSPWKGPVWSFSIPPKTAYNPDPADGAEFVDPNAVFTWTPGFGAKLHNVYMGTSFDEVNNAAGGAPLGSASYSPAALESEKVYYWRVDEFDPPTTYKGDIWSFTTPGAVGNPQPANGAVDVQMNATLSWTAADNATSHELYFGTDPDAVNSAATASPEYIGPMGLGAESYDPGGLAWDSSYAWRVDEVYPTETIKGLVWSFTTADFIGVDDFESYNDVDPPETASNRIFDKWIDGFGTTTNGALVGNDLPPYAEQSIVHGGAQSLVYGYDNNLKTSEATLTLVYPRDWTADGVTKLSLWFRGSTSNSAERMFVALGNSVVYHDDASATQITGWNEWVIDLTRFAGVDLANVLSITIGFGTRNPGAPGPGGTGTMYFDDIRLYR
ncbi:MAG: LamG domain-containing protein [Phycisphaerae bacterium]|nr:LamG domain-containing protein [Phycisphaerae bacterium]